MEKTAVVSGGTKGIGLAIVERFVKQGYTVITCARNQDDLNNLKDRFAEKVHTFSADLSQKNEVLSFADFILSKTSSIDVLVNNTGVFLPGAIHNEDEGNLELMINTNVYSAYYLTRALVKSMIDRRSGDIFNICSVASNTAYANGGSYSISKFAMHGMTKGLREELKEHDIRVVSVLPGATYTASWEGNTDLPINRFMKSEDVADAVWSAHQLSKNSVVEEITIRPQLGDI